MRHVRKINYPTIAVLEFLLLPLNHAVFFSSEDRIPN